MQGIDLVIDSEHFHNYYRKLKSFFSKQMGHSLLRSGINGFSTSVVIVEFLFYCAQLVVLEGSTNAL